MESVFDDAAIEDLATMATDAKAPLHPTVVRRAAMEMRLARNRGDEEAAEAAHEALITEVSTTPEERKAAREARKASRQELVDMLAPPGSDYRAALEHVATLEPEAAKWLYNGVGEIRHASRYWTVDEAVGYIRRGDGVYFKNADHLREAHDYLGAVLAGLATPAELRSIK
jgi:hypothetical protein